MNEIKVTRKTTESQMSVVLSEPPLKADYRSKINSPIIFLNHMIEHIAWRSGLNIEIDVRLDKFFLAHVVCEDLGIALGKAVGEYVKCKKANGINGYGEASSIIDEAKAQCLISFESRSYLDFTSVVEIPAEAEDMHSEDLQVFLDGFAQGANCTLHVDIQKGKNAHHIWEATYRAFGLCLNDALYENPSRKNMTSGVAGSIDWEII